ncbi:hypothetical protein ACLNGM_15185 [Aureimonas phyllosphaerae]|uniref:hypothetical protein n=1 Tax=Aureimonas phyllosphaerae TaxID=1166078 RepID=UPI003A5BF6B0
MNAYTFSPDLVLIRDYCRLAARDGGAITIIPGLSSSEEVRALQAALSLGYMTERSYVTVTDDRIEYALTDAGWNLAREQAPNEPPIWAPFRFVSGVFDFLFGKPK